jgi:hypothetical protein
VKAIDIADSQNQAITDPKFHDFFKDLLKKHKLKEAYLCEAMGSYLFLTKNGTSYGLVVNNKDQLELCAEAAEAQNLDVSLIQALRGRKKIMFHHNRYDSFAPPPEEWENHLYPSHPFEGQKDTYYYAFAPSMFNIDAACVLSFQDYRAEKRFEIQS